MVGVVQQVQMQYQMSEPSWTMSYIDTLRLLCWWPRCDPRRVYLLILCGTGMRTRECDRLKRSDFKSGGVVYKLGKNQRGCRSVLLPAEIYNELMEYLESNPTTEDNIWPNEERYGIKTKFGYGRCVNRALQKIRGFLGGKFLTKVRGAGAIDSRYIYNIKSFRANYQCVLWFAFYSQPGPLGGSGELAASFVSKEMHHSGHSFGLTAKHYISGAHAIQEDLPKLKRFVIDGKVKLHGQTRLLDYN